MGKKKDSAREDHGQHLSFLKLLQIVNSVAGVGKKKKKGSVKKLFTWKICGLSYKNRFFPVIE